MQHTRIIELTSRGYAPAIVASACGITTTEVLELLSLPEVREQVSALRLTTAVRHVEQDTSIDSLETAALEKMHKLLPFITDPMKALRVYQVANAAVRKAPTSQTSNDNRAPTVVINLPAHAALQFRMSTDKQIVEVDGRSVATLPSNVLAKRLVEQQTTRQITDSASAEAMLAGLISPTVQVRNVLQPA